MTTYEFHELANIFPMLGDEELKELCADIEKNGLAEPITLYEGKILDGRNRATACERLGIEPMTVEYTGNDPIAFVLSKNLHRRHLTTSQRAVIAEELANMSEGRQKLTAGIPAVSQTEAAKILNVSRDSVQQVAKLRRESSPEVIEQVKRGEKTINAALSERTPKEQPRRKTVAKESEPEGKFIKVEKRWEPEVVAMEEWWDTMPTAYRQLTGGEEVAGCLKIPIPSHHNVVLALFRKMCEGADEDSAEIRENLITEVRLLANRIEELYY